jgi:hypothetical protein
VLPRAIVPAILLSVGLVWGVAAAPSASAPARTQSQRAAIGSWWDRTDPGRGKLPQSRYYSIRSDLGRDLSTQYAAHLDTMYDEYSRRLVQGGGLRRRSPEFLNVYMFARQQDYLDTMRTRFGINAQGSGGMFFVAPQRGAGLAFFVEDLPRQRVEHVIQHEGFHQFAAAFFGNDLPPWLNEGLAEFFGESVVEGRTVVIGQASPQVVAQVRDAVKRGQSIPFLDLLSMDDARWNANVRSGQAALQYMQSWSVVHFLVYGADGKYQPNFQALLQLVNAGTKPLDAMRKAFRFRDDGDLAVFESKWKEYAAAAKPGAYIAARGRLEFLAEGLAEVWAKGARPATLDELKSALREDKFTYVATTHGYMLQLSAADDANFAVPDDDVNAKPVTIELVPATPAKGASKPGKGTPDVPFPPAIRTRGLAPKDVAVAWRRRAGDPTHFDYEIGAVPTK